MRLPTQPMMSPEATPDTLALWTYLSTVQKLLSGLGTIEQDPVTGAILIRDLTGATRVIIGFIGPDPEDWGIQIFSPTGVLMFDSTTGGATTAGIQPDAVSVINNVTAESIVTTSSTTFGLVPDMSLPITTTGGAVLVTGQLVTARLTNTDVAEQTVVGRIRLVRDTTVLTSASMALQIPTSAFYFPFQLTYIDAGLPAGTYTYTLEWCVSTVLGYTPAMDSVFQRTMQAVELKR